MSRYTSYDYAGRRKTLRTQPTLASGIPTDAGGSLTTWNYSTTSGQLLSKLDDAGKGASYTYTSAGRPLTRAWARGITTTYGYTAGQLTSTDYSDATPDVTTAFDRLGRPVTAIQANQSQIVTTYDPATLRAVTETISYDLDHDGTYDFSRVLDRSQDTLGRDTGFELKDGTTLEYQAGYTYDTAGRLATVADASDTFTYGYQYNQTTAADPRVGSTTGTKQDLMPYTLTKSGSPVHQTLRTYEARRDALAIIENNAGATTRSSYTYSVNNLGQRTDLTTAFDLGTGVTANPGDTGWAYDTLGQVQSAAAPGTDADRYFSYDEIGNRLLSRTGTATNSGGTLTEYFGVLTPSPVAGANALNQYVGIAQSGTTIEPVFDDDGNATSYPLPAYPSANSTLAWDAENRQTSATVNSVTTTYLYDAMSRRIAKIPPTGSATLYLYDGFNCIAEFSYSALPVPSSELTKSRTWGLDLSGTLQGAGGVGGLLAEKQGGDSFYPTYDGNGNVSEFLATDGSTAAHFEYDPFGNTVVNTDTGNLFAYRFSTKPLDFETGLYYYGYRYYDPVTGRWLSKDPLEEAGGVNLYGFVGNDGIGKWDFLGLALKSETVYNQNGLRIDVELPYECPKAGEAGKANTHLTYKGDKYFWDNSKNRWLNEKGQNPPKDIRQLITKNPAAQRAVRKAFGKVNCGGGFAPKYGGGKAFGIIAMLFVVVQTDQAYGLIEQYREALLEGNYARAAELRTEISTSIPDTGTMRQTEFYMLLEEAEKEYKEGAADDCCCPEGGED